MSAAATAAMDNSSSGVFDGCSDSCGWIAAAISMLAYGTYGVPIKETLGSGMPADLNPLVFQSYKSTVMFGMAPCVLLLAGVPFTFTPWGILSGLFWVLGGTGGVVAVRWAGMATAVGTWSSVMICVNFVWGILIFEEPVANVRNTAAAFVLLGLGLIGMSKFGAPSSSARSSDDEVVELPAEYPVVNERVRLLTGAKSGEGAIDVSLRTDTLKSDIVVVLSSFNPETHVYICGVILRKRAAGIMAAVFNGLMSGTSLIPLHYAERYGFGGPDYIMSYAAGALLSNIGIWIIYYAVLVVRLHRKNEEVEISWKSKLQRAAESMPEMYFRQLWKTGLCAGTYINTF
jgi:hypothetical protein